MKALEFETTLSEGATLKVPENLAVGAPQIGSNIGWGLVNCAGGDFANA